MKFDKIILHEINSPGLNFQGHIVKKIINQTDGERPEIILIRHFKYKNRTSKNSLAKLQLVKEGVWQYRGLNLSDMVLIKKNWPVILKELAS